MHPIHILIAAFAVSTTPLPAQDETIVVTAAREPVSQAVAPASTTVLDGGTLSLLGFPLATDALRLVPGLSVAVSGPAGSQAQIRIRGAEANHSLLFVDGIRFNDPAAGNEARFELLTSDALSRIEVVRGPQSALWGSEALGGVIAVETGDARRAGGLSARAEYGSLDTARASAQGALRRGNLGLSASGTWLRGDGIDAFDSGGEHDGFENRSASLKAVYAPAKSSEIGLVGHWVEGESEFDGFDPVTFLRTDTLDATENRIAAGRAWGRTSWGSGGQNSVSAGVSLLDSSNRNRVGQDPVNRTSGRRWTFDGQLSLGLAFAGAAHRLTAAAEHQAEDFRARDEQYGGATDQDRNRTLTAFAGEWRAEWGQVLVSDLAVRHDRFSEFADATTFRASLLARLGSGWSVHAAFGEGIAQPTFYDLFGFFPGSFVGNPALRPESSKSWETAVRWANVRTSVSLSAFTARLRDEIVDVYDPVTFLSSTANVDGKSSRRGIEIDARARIGQVALIAFNYSFLDAKQRHSGLMGVREVRRPRHSANVLGTLRFGKMELGTSLAYVGKRRDTDFESFPARNVTLDAYVLGSIDLGWAIAPAVTAYARAENAFGANYQDAFGYATPGRTVHAGLRFRLGD